VNGDFIIFTLAYFPIVITTNKHFMMTIYDFTLGSFIIFLSTAQSLHLLLIFIIMGSSHSLEGKLT